MLQETPLKTGFDHTLLPWIGRIGIGFGVQFSKRLRELGIHTSKEQWIVLKYLYSEEGLSQNDLAAIIGRDKASVTRLIDNMEKKGYLRREICVDDKRVRQIFLEEKGKNLYDKTLPVMEDIIDQIQTGLSVEELDITLKTLKKVKLNLQNLS